MTLWPGGHDERGVRMHFRRVLSSSLCDVLDLYVEDNSNELIELSFPS